MQFEQEFKIGQRVRVVEDASKPWTADWRDTYVVVGAALEYQKGGEVNYSLATVDEIEHRLGSTDGFEAKHLTATPS